MVLSRFLSIFGCFLFAAFLRAADKPVKVFVLAGQSNMQGTGFVKADPKRNGGKGSLEYLVKDPATADRFKHLVSKDGKWVVRDDVWIHYFDRKGKLTVGFAGNGDQIGPELGFGHIVGDALEEPVLLIKLAWGGKSLAKDFRPPSSGGDVGPYYKEIVQRTKDVLSNIDKEFPQWKGRGHELAGFGWHQGWNDRVNQAFNDEYEKNMANFIRDIRKDLGVKNLPFVIAETGMSGSEEKHPRALSLMKAQAAVAEYKEFKGNVAFVGTKAFWRAKEVSPSGQAFHWNTNAETYYLIGEAMGKAMTKLCATKAQSTDGDFKPDQSKLPVPAPKNAIVLLDDKGNHSFLSMAGEAINWPIKDGMITPTFKGNRNHIVSKLHFRDADIHVEFMLPEKGPGNSGVYIHGHYEVQIFNSFGKQAVTQEDAGALYGFHKPLVNACRKPGEWQVFDIRYRAPRRDKSGKITENGTVTVWFNGKKVQDVAAFGEPRSTFHPFRFGTTPYLEKIRDRQKQTMTGPVFLQDHGNPVQFRNIWVIPSDDLAFVYDPTGK
ncbi:MAG TPA: family 16 glycoside hydrolase [Gemmataceae bacterium]|nr:family 16 glycoside hydrolase [Gemmataceae bacterium]